MGDGAFVPTFLSTFRAFARKLGRSSRQRDAVMRSRLRWLGEQVGWLLGIAASLLLMLVLLPLVPLFEMYEDIRRAYEDK